VEEIEAKKETKIEVWKKVQNCANSSHEQVMDKCKLWRITNIIVDFIWKTLTTYE